MLESEGYAKASLLNIELRGMNHFCKIFFDNIEDSTYLESCGLADLINTCYSGCNRLCAKSFAKIRIEDSGTNIGDVDNHFTDTTTTTIAPEECMPRWNKIADNLLKFQRLQGKLTCKDMNLALQESNMLEKFPLIKTMDGVSLEGTYLFSLIKKGIIITPFTASDECRTQIGLNLHGR